MPFLGQAPSAAPVQPSRDAVIDRIKNAVVESAAIRSTLDAAADPVQNTPAAQATAASAGSDARAVAQQILDEHAVHVQTMQRISDATTAAQQRLARLRGGP